MRCSRHCTSGRTSRGSGLDAGTAPPIFDAPSPGDVFDCVAAPINTYGVIMFVKYDFHNSKVYIYKHS